MIRRAHAFRDMIVTLSAIIIGKDCQCADAIIDSTRQMTATGCITISMCACIATITRKLPHTYNAAMALSVFAVLAGNRARHEGHVVRGVLMVGS